MRSIECHSAGASLGAGLLHTSLAFAVFRVPAAAVHAFLQTLVISGPFHTAVRMSSVLDCR